MKNLAFLRFSALIIASSSFLLSDAVVAQEVVQGWNQDERNTMYYGSQGSRLIPKAWFDALELKDGTPFIDIDHLTSFGLLPPSDKAPTKYPIGIAIDQQSDRSLSFSKLPWSGQGDLGDTAERWVGLNCSACHTGSYLVGDKLAIVDGAPSMFDYQSFVNALDDAMEGTLNDPVRWSRFATKVLSGKNTPDNEALKKAFISLLDWEKKADAMNENDRYYDGRVLKYGYGRVDAIGHIFNKVVMFNRGSEADGNPANAPVSYPFLWNMWKQDKVQWNGSVANSRKKIGAGWIEYGALGRNTGEVLGVFGDIVITPKSDGILSALSGYQSSVNVRNLDRIEHILKKLESPNWPDTFPFEKNLATIGETLFRQNCANCHLTPDMQEPGKPTERMLPFINTPKWELTDIWMACNAFVYSGPTGPMKGTKDLDGNVMGDTAPVFNMLGTAVKGALLDKKGDIIKEAVSTIFGFERLPEVSRAPGIFDPRAGERETCLTTKGVDILAYKARPLDGIWATAPYLHNGSVASLYELLLPAEQRVKQFWVGNRAFNTKDVGYVDAEPADGQGFLFETRNEDGVVIEGNGNQGHEYGAAKFSPDDRRALVEYLKSL
ncbi:di-heme-cytochrome C peroxidase [Rhizobium leguminosarum]|uniref:di-heme-cytochrome C peroxidase n=1 Tax=Rhizobium leguminosarum TaxID=384 RepID=UPI003F9E76DB